MMRRIAWLVGGCVIIALAAWLLPRWEFSSEQVILLREADVTLAPEQAKIAAAMDRDLVPHGFLLTGHNVSSGNGIVLAYRKSSGRPFAVFESDTDKFQYLTVLLPGDLRDITSTTYDLAAPGNGTAYFSAATLGFATRHGCFGFARNGTIKIHRGTMGDAKVELRLDIETMSLSTVNPGRCGRVEFSGEYQSKVLDLAEFDQKLTIPSK